DELRSIHEMTEGIEYRLKKAINEVTSFSELIERVKTKRYTQTKLQRLFVHTLLNNKKTTIENVTSQSHISYIRLLGMTKKGRNYLRINKKAISVPIWSNLNKANEKELFLDEKAANVYYSILPVQKINDLRKKEFAAPILIEK